MEKPRNPEQNEKTHEQIAMAIEELSGTEGMSPEDIDCDLIVFADVEGNESANIAYLEELAELLGISLDEMRKYAKKRYEEHHSEESGE